MAAPHQTQCQQYLSCYLTDLDQTLKVGSREHLEQISAVTVTFVQVTFVLATFVHIKNISAITDPILTKRLNLIFLGPLIFLDQHLFDSIYFEP